MDTKNGNEQKGLTSLDTRCCSMRLAVLLWCQITQSVCRTLLVEKRDVVILFHGHLTRHMGVHEQLRLNLAVDGLLNLPTWCIS